MIVGLGIDIVDTKRFEEIAKNKSFRFEYFSKIERELDDLSLAGRFAAREALFKASKSPESIDWHDVEVVNEVNGAPRFVFKDRTADLFASKVIHLSITHVPEYAIAMVVIEVP